jgi:hypothetical protein
MNILKKINPTFAVALILSALFVYVQWPSSSKEEPTPTIAITLLSGQLSGEIVVFFEGEPEHVEKEGKTDINNSQIKLSAYQSRRDKLWVSAMQFNYEQGFMDEHQAAEIELTIKKDVEAFKGTLVARETCNLGEYEGIRYVIVNENTTFSKDNCLIVVEDKLVIVSSSFKATEEIVARSKAFFDAIK